MERYKTIISARGTIASCYISELMDKDNTTAHILPESNSLFFFFTKQRDADASKNHLIYYSISAGDFLKHVSS